MSSILIITGTCVSLLSLVGLIWNFFSLANKVVETPWEAASAFPRKMLFHMIFGAGLAVGVVSFIVGLLMFFFKHV